MSEQSLISEIKTYIWASGPVTCTQIATAINAAPQDVISVIREAVDRGSLAEKKRLLRHLPSTFGIPPQQLFMG
ncbi:hypothetical protein J1L90_004353 [Salmonella enterica subsp. enterica serovar Thompson]|nr:hypothetical protein [Salmonella enterica]EHF4167634.1 hypothetical protein [Salmonella enterica subsp. enterica serovar Thompson]ELV5264624.1 hypothetical protein [Salmonella enterica]